MHAHAAAALINFCEGVERDTLVPYLDAIVARLLKLLEPQYSEKDGRLRSYVQEQAVTTLAMVADVSEATFAKVCSLCSFFLGLGCCVFEAEAEDCICAFLFIALCFDHAVAVECATEREWSRA